MPVGAAVRMDAVSVGIVPLRGAFRYVPGKSRNSMARMRTPASVVTSVTIIPILVKSQKVIVTFLLACWRTMRLATELNGVKLPANVLELAKASQAK